jgi:PKHD-type hydroxylase
MSAKIVSILSAGEVDCVRAVLSRAHFVDGAVSATGMAREVKHNLQADQSDPEVASIGGLVVEALRRSSTFQQFVIPKLIIPPTFSRYEAGMKYGSHVDSAMMGRERLVRTDMAITLFLSDPESYDGGELTVEIGLSEQSVKLAAGEAIVYEATEVHRVKPVTRGVRLAAITWIQSAVHDGRLRTILADLHCAIQDTEPVLGQESKLLLKKSYHNLLRYSIEG